MPDLIVIPHSPEPTNLTWISRDPTLTSDALDATRFSRKVASQWFELVAEYPPMTHDETIIYLFEEAAGRHRLISMPIYPPREKHGFHVGNFVQFSDHEKLYRLMAIHHEVDPSLTRLASPGLPDGWRVYPTPRSLEGVLQVAESFRCSLDSDAFTQKHEAAGFIRVQVKLRERPTDAALDNVVRYSDRSPVQYGNGEDMLYQ